MRKEDGRNIKSRPVTLCTLTRRPSCEQISYPWIHLDSSTNFQGVYSAGTRRFMGYVFCSIAYLGSLKFLVIRIMQIKRRKRDTSRIEKLTHEDKGGGCANRDSKPHLLSPGSRSRKECHPQRTMELQPPAASPSPSHTPDQSQHHRPDHPAAYPNPRARPTQPPTWHTLPGP